MPTGYTNMRTFLLILTIAAFTFGTSFRVSTANTDRFAVWDHLDAATAQLFNDQQISEYEDQTFEEVLGLGRSGHTEEAIKALNTFLKDNRNTALREVARETMTELMAQRKANAALRAKRAGERTACTMEMKVCPNGVTFVGREGPRCEFAPCPVQ